MGQCQMKIDKTSPCTMQSNELWSIIFSGQKLIEWLWTITVQMSKIRLNTGGLLRQQTNIIAVKMWPVYRGPFSDFFWGEGAAVHRLWTGGSYDTFSELFCTELNTVRPAMISTIFFLYCPTEILTWSYIRPLKKDKILAAITLHQVHLPMEPTMWGANNYLVRTFY